MTGVPQSWQNFDPGVSPTPQALHRASRTTAPHCVQKRPPAAAPQDGQGIVAERDWSVLSVGVIWDSLDSTTV